MIWTVETSTMTLLQDLLKPEILLSIVLMALILLRLPVRPRVSLYIDAPPEKVFAVLDVFDGKHQNYGHSSVTQTLLDAGTQLYRFAYTTLMHNGRVREFDAKFRIAERVESRRLVLAREGLDGKPKANQLLNIVHDLVPEGRGTRLHTEYRWGPRLLLAQLIARADLLGGSYRTKGLAETGKVNDRPYNIISTVLAFLTALASVLAFGFFLGTPAAVMIVFVLFIHELGHMIAYRMIGQPWGRMMFLPFLGAIAIPKLPFEKQSQIVFAALMGPGFSLILAIACFAIVQFNAHAEHYRYPLIWLGLLTVGINVINLVPIEPLDGGVVLRSILARLTKSYARLCLIALSLAFAAVGMYFNIALLVIFSVIALAFNIKPRIIDEGLVPMSRAQMAYGGTAFVGISGIYIALMIGFIAHLQG
jgi:Zn-dependent protease